MATNNEIEWKDCWKKPVKVQYKEITKTAEIRTREGKPYGYAGIDVLLKGIKGEVYPCKIDIFNATYTTTAPLSEEAIRADAIKQYPLMKKAEEKAIRADERAKSVNTILELKKTHSKDLEYMATMQEKRIHIEERQRCIQAISQNSFIGEVKNRLKGFAIYETDYRIKMIVREVIYKLSENIGNKHPHKLICECGDVKSMHVGNYAGRCKRILCGCPKFKLSEKSGEEGQNATAKHILKKVDACWKDMGLGRQGFDWDEYYDIKKEYKVD